MTFELGGFTFETHIRDDEADWDQGIVEWIFKRLYDPQGFEVPNGIVLDIGAHIGGFSIYASQTASKIYAYEPEPSNFNLLMRNLRRNNIKNVEAHQIAVHDMEGTFPFYVVETKNTGGHSLLKKGPGVPFTTIDVKAIAFSGIISELGDIGFVKMDCEGCEHPTLLSATDEILQKIEKLAIEVHDPAWFGELREKLERNFTITVREKHHMMLARRK